MILLISLLACFTAVTPEEKAAATETWCANVTEENWHTARWRKTSKETCQEAFLIRGPTERPCTFGGLPAYCSTASDGYMNIWVVGAGGQPISVIPQDVERIKPHLVIH